MEIGTTGMVVDVPMIEHGLDLQGELMVNSVEDMDGMLNEADYEGTVVDKS